MSQALVLPVNETNPLDTKRVEGQPESQSEEALQQTTEQQQYQSFFEGRLTRAQEQRDRKWPEFSDKTYLKYYEHNEKVANTYLEPKKNEDDVQIASGTLEAKLNTLVAHLDNLNLTPEVRAFDSKDKPLSDLGLAFTDILDRVAEHDGGSDGGDAEKRMLRQKELLKQGTVFVQDKWCTKRQAKKILTKKYDGTFNFNAWETSWKKVYEGPERVLLYGPNVYLGDITQFAMSDQPYVFTSETMSYDMGKTLFGDFENWKYVRKGMPPAPTSSATNAVGGRTIYDGKFRLTNLQDTQIEVIKYQDPIRDEFQIMINGVLMLPIGFPLSAVSQGGRINIAKQVLYPINPQYAYGKSFVSSGDVYELSKILDEMLRLFVLKTRKSITPPYINTSGKVISRRVLSPGNISQGIPPNALVQVGNESQGVTSGEYQVYQELLMNIDRSTIGPAFQGQQSAPGTTATEIVNVQRQAKLSLGIIVAACSMLETKLAYLRLPILLANYFQPTGDFLDGDGSVQKSYKQTSREVPIEGAGRGVRILIPMNGPLPSRDVVRALEIQNEKEYGMPYQIIYLSPKKIQEAELTWRVNVSPKEKETNATDKLLFRESITDALALFSLGSKPNPAGLEEEFSRIYGVDRNRFFATSNDIQVPPMATDASTTAGNRQSKNMPKPSGVPSAPPPMTDQVGAASP